MESAPYKPVELHLFVQRNEEKLKEKPCQLISGINLFIIQAQSMPQGYTRAGDALVDVVVDDFSKRMMEIIFCTKDDF